MTVKFNPLPWDTGPAGRPRLIGIEIEMAGVELATMATAVQAEFGGRISAG